MGQALGDMITRFGPMILSFLGGQDLQNAQQEATEQNELRYGQGLGIQADSNNRSWDTFNQGYNDLANFYQGALPRLSADAATLGGTVANSYQNRAGDIMGGFNQGAENIGSGYGQLNQNAANRTQHGMSYLDNASGQARADINERYDAYQGQNEQDLVSRGLTGSTVRAGVRGITDRERSGELRRLDEGVRREYLDTYGKFTGDQLAAQQAGLGSRERLLAAGTGFRSGLSGDSLSAMERGGERSLAYDENAMNTLAALQERQTLGRIGMDTDQTNRALNWIGGRQDTYPQTNPWLQMAQQLGQSAGGNGGGGGGGSGFEASSLIAPGISAGAGIGAAGLGAGAWGAGKAVGAAFTFGLGALACISGDANIETTEGNKQLKDVQVDDLIKNTKGQFRRVVFKDFGFSQPEQIHNFITITTDISTITITRDHILDDKPAGEWKVGDRMRTARGYAEVESIEPTEACDCGDFLLEDGTGYIANGFHCGSMLALAGCDPKVAIAKRNKNA